MNTKKHKFILTDIVTKEKTEYAKKDTLKIQDVIFSELYESTSHKKCIGIVATYKNVTAKCTHNRYTVIDFLHYFKRSFDDVAYMTIEKFIKNNLV